MYVPINGINVTVYMYRSMMVGFMMLKHAIIMTVGRESTGGGTFH